jgi:hypothetical protein
MASRAQQAAAKRKAATTKARSDANKREMRDAAATSRTKLVESRSKLEPEQAPKRKRALKDTSRPNFRQVAAQYGDRIIVGREQHGYTWQGIAEVLHLIPRGADVPRNTKVWGHVVVWNAYKLLKEQRGEEPQRKVLRGAQKGNGNAQVDQAPKHNPDAKLKPTRKERVLDSHAEQTRTENEAAPAKRKRRTDDNRPARGRSARQRKALGLEELEHSALVARLEGRRITYRFSNAALGTSEPVLVGKVDRVGAMNGGRRLAVWFYSEVAVDERKRAVTSNLRTVYVDQIVEVS